jgi:SAM-dependent methyltransferase
MLQKLKREVFVRTHRFWGFLEADAIALNQARMAHLASLRLPVDGKSVLEVGGGIGLLTGFFEERGCSVLSTDARPENVAEMKRRWPGRRVATLDLEQPDAIRAIGKFDVVFCYGTLYHLAAPEPALAALSEVSDLILLETCVSRGDEDASPLVPEELTMNQAIAGLGSRPTRRWVLNRLMRYWGNGYVSVTQPDHPDFPTDWTVAPARPLTRAVFAGSKTPLANAELTAGIPSRQERYVSRR